ncbi:hypothetical protein [Aurantimonas sp. VKM B-3413]|uniref:hypothetical protein n=1 Tax=Aurantimonas sp. VKM B-3413 TaxID=2779401 RepID=UPI001E2AFD47|nr:hypothetical protein [Aurantimonas sp. VKM B-3413]MCB8838098.1 hypothetical protein [Aurantimonas sp. VKM B-3413]
MTNGRTGWSNEDGKAAPRRWLILAGVLAAGLVVTGCTDGTARLPPVFGAVFGLEGAETAPFRVGTIPKPEVGPGDEVIGLAANSPGECVYRRRDNRRFFAACPEGYSG